MRRALLILAVAWNLAAAPAPPRPAADHPGNIFVLGEQVTVPLPPGEGEPVVTDYEGRAVAAQREGDLLRLREPNIGYYEVRRFQDGQPGPKTTIGIIAPLTAPTPPTSPISIDVAMAWFYKTEQTQRAAASLCQLAGINWVRDRLNWTEMEPKRGTFAKHNIYDDTARLQSEMGLRILQVNHIAAPWAHPDARRLPLDLRDAHRFYREMAKRWKGQVLAIEPWNEADIDVFGGHTGSEMASMQKASYLGLKAGNPDGIACQNVFAIARQSTLDDFALNEPSGYFDTYNLHHYVGFDKYPETYAAHRAISAGKPMWVSECNVTVNWADEKTKEPNDESLRWQANRVAKVFSMSLFEGSVNTFYFMLPHYVEHQKQFGVLHEDLTPRPAYVALAAVGRLMADAKPIGRWKANDAKIFGYFFRAKPDGEDKIVLVAWSNKPAALQLDQPVERVFDHLGRERTSGELHLSAAPTFAVLAAHAQVRGIDPPPTPPPLAQGKRSPIVLQLLVPPEQVDLNQSAYILPPDRAHDLKVRAYNFGDKRFDEVLSVKMPRDWTIRLPEKVTVSPSEMVELKVTIDARSPSKEINLMRLSAADATLAFRIVDTKGTSDGSR